MASTLEVQLPSGETAEVQVPEGMSANDLHSTIDDIVKQHQPKQPEPVGDFQSNFNQLAPSNVLKSVGVASANAPGATQMMAGMLPGGDPNQLMQGVRNVAQNPQQLSQAFNRVAQTNAGQPMNPQEQVPGTIGQIAGTGIEAVNAPNPFKGMKPTGPFTVGLTNPETAIPGALDKAGKDLGIAKDLARRGDDPAIAGRMRRLLTTQNGISKLAEEGKAAVEAGKNSTVTELLAYKQALGTMQSKGGTFANDYKNAFDLASEQLAAKAPELAKKLASFSLNATASEGPGIGLPFLTAAVSPEIGAAKMAYNIARAAPVRNAVGAALSHPAGISSALLEAFNRLSKRKGQ